MVRATELTEPAILEAIRKGYFYASQGPTIEEWVVKGKSVYLRCSPVERIQIHASDNTQGGYTALGQDGALITEVSFTFRSTPRCIRATCIDPHFKRAWTNPFFTE